MLAAGLFLAGLFGSSLQRPAFSQPVRGPRVRQARPCAQLCPNSEQLLVLAEPSRGASCKLPPSRLSLLCGYGAGKCCESCQVHAAGALWHPLPSSNSSLFWSVACTAQTSPAAPEQQPPAGTTPTLRPPDLWARLGEALTLTVAQRQSRTQKRNCLPRLRQTLAWFIILCTAQAHRRQPCVCPARCD